MSRGRRAAPPAQAAREPPGAAPPGEGATAAGPSGPGMQTSRGARGRGPGNVRGGSGVVSAAQDLVGSRHARSLRETGAKRPVSAGPWGSRGGRGWKGG